MGQVGAMPPLGYFDPAGFSKKGDESGFRTLRAAEIKHGRVAMMAALGGVVQHYVKFPGFEKEPGNFGDPVGLGQYDDDMRNKELNNGRFAMFAAIGIISAELLTGKDAIE